MGWLAGLHMTTSAWAAVAIVALPIVVVLGALGLKLLWGLWPIPLALAASGWATWRLGLDWFWLLAVGIVAGVVATWLWQRTVVFLRVDRRLEKGMFLGD